MSDVVIIAITGSVVVLAGLVIVVRSLGHRITKISIGADTLTAELAGVTETQQKQSEEMRLIAKLTRMLVSEYQRKHLAHLDSGKWETSIHRALVIELSYLLAIGLAERQPGHGIRSLEEKERQGEAQDDVCTHLRITDQGREYLAMVEDFEERKLGG